MQILNDYDRDVFNGDLGNGVNYRKLGHSEIFFRRPAGEHKYRPANRITVFRFGSLKLPILHRSKEIYLSHMYG
jgi:ATP-dependent exoDNAse (exonuclease V) alpha subunit